MSHLKPKNRIRIISPHETESTILDKRPHDASSKGFDKFEFLSVHFWDERFVKKHDSYDVHMNHIIFVTPIDTNYD